MKRTILSIFGLCLLGVASTILLSSNSGGRAFSANSGNTGAPGESTTCIACHGTGLSASVSMSIKDANGNVVNSYVPGTIYTIDFIVNSVGASRWGFQITSLRSSNSAAITSFSNPSSNARIVNLGSGRQYVEHAGASTTNTFTSSWTAPASGTGDVIFYGAGNAANNNGRTSGDGASTTTLVLTESTTVGIEELDEANPVSFYPNPAREVLNVEAPAQYTNAQVSLINKKGQIVLQERLTQGTVHQINTDSFRNGVYLLRVEAEEQSFVGKVIFK